MADYWKSQAKKFCEFCKCWIADNKPSVEFHEKGKRHKENVAIRLKNISSQSQKDHAAKRKMDEDIKKMEKAALEAYVKDVESNADYTSRVLNKQFKDMTNERGNISTLIGNQGSGEITLPETPKTGSKVNVKVWYEAKSDEGYTYYWNTETSESVWEPPEGCYVTLDDQKKLADKELKQETEKKIETRLKEEKQRMKIEECRAYLEREKMRSSSKVEEKTKKKIMTSSASNRNPFGSWTTVKVCEKQDVDLQLPQQRNRETSVQPPHASEPAIKFKEKHIGTLESDVTGDINFKKRKLHSGSTRNMRQRFIDD